MDYEDNFKQFLKDSGCEERQTEQMYGFANSNNKNNSAEKTGKEKSSTVKQLFKRNLDVENKEELAYTFQDMPPASKESLEIIFHKPIYDLPIPTNLKYKKLSISERVKLLDNYYIKVSELKTRLAKKSLHRAPYSKPILPSTKCKNSLLKNPDQDEDEAVEEFVDQVPTQEFYVSRKGRQVKRKIYTEDVENDIDGDPDFGSSIKKNKSTIDSDTKITLDTPFVPEENHNEEDNASKPVKTRKDTPRRILTTHKKTPRCEEMFENLLWEDEKMKQKEKERAVFEKSLQTLDEADEDNFFMDDKPTEEENEENFLRKRVIPPIPTKKGSKSKKQITQDDFDKIDIVPSSPPDSPILKHYSNVNKKSNTKRNQNKAKSEENLLSEESTEINKRDCPICGKQFPQTEIEDHAAGCENFKPETSKFQDEKIRSDRITCELCDRVFLVNKDYEVHVKQCIAAKVTDL